jgi:hypothetical protein
VDIRPLSTTAEATAASRSRRSTACPFLDLVDMGEVRRATG